MALGPVLQIRKIVEHQSSSGNSVGYFVILLVGFALWMAYGVAASNLALIIPNAVAAVVITATIAVTWRYRKSPSSSPARVLRNVTRALPPTLYEIPMEPSDSGNEGNYERHEGPTSTRRAVEWA